MNKLISTSIVFFTLCASALVSAQNTNTFPLTGNVGIGTTTPAFLLDVSTAGAVMARLKGSSGNTASNNAQLRFAGGKNGELWAIGTDISSGSGSKNFEFYDLPNSASRFTIASGGNVGIGTNVPTEKLTINSGRISIEKPAGAWGNNTMKINENSIEVSRADDREVPLYLNYGGVYSNPVVIGNSINTSDTYLRVAGYVNARKVNIGGVGDYNIMKAGDPNADYKLAVNGKIVAKSIYVTMSGWGDFVFDKNYQRMNWIEKRDFFEMNKHLPGLAKASEIEQTGVNMSETLKHVTINVEENSLDIIDLYQRLEKLETENRQLKKELTSFKNGAGR
jgi:hypothetical protein